MAKRKTKKEIQGLGDVIANVTSAVGIEPCLDCKERQFGLNRLFNFKKVKSEMNAIDKEHFKIFLDFKGQRIIDGKRTELVFEDLSYLNGCSSSRWVSRTCTIGCSSSRWVNCTKMNTKAHR